MERALIVRVGPENLGGTILCITGPFASEGCHEDLSDKILSAWDGTDTPFTVRCGCGRVYRYQLRVVLDVEKEDCHE